MKKFRSGFTIVEILIVMAILGIVLTAGTSVFLSTVSSSNKTKAQIDVKEAGRNASEQITRRVQSARTLSQPPGNTTQVTIGDSDGVSSTLTCINGNSTTNGRLEIQSNATGLTTALTFDDVEKGVNVTDCSLVVVNGASGKEPPALRYSFTVSQPIGAPQRPEYQASIKIESSVVSRSYEF